MIALLVTLALTPVSDLTQGDMIAINKGYPYEQSRCAITEINDVLDYGDGDNFVVETSDFFVLKKKDETYYVYCTETHRIEVIPSISSSKLKHSEMDYSE